MHIEHFLLSSLASFEQPVENGFCIKRLPSTKINRVLCWGPHNGQRSRQQLRGRLKSWHFIADIAIINVGFSLIICLNINLSAQLDRSVMTAIATGDQSVKNKSLVKQWCHFMNLKVPVPLFLLWNYSVYRLWKQPVSLSTLRSLYYC